MFLCGVAGILIPPKIPDPTALKHNHTTPTIEPEICNNPKSVLVSKRIYLNPNPNPTLNPDCTPMLNASSTI